MAAHRSSEETPRVSRITRRKFIGDTGKVALAVAAGPSLLAACGDDEPQRQTGKRLSGDLRILQWSHFVPRYDTWFDAYAKQWGTENGVRVTVDHVALADLPSRVSSEISSGSGHDLIEFLSPPSQFEPSVIDLTDINQEAERRFGKQVDLARKSSFNPNTKKFYGFCHAWVPDPGDYRKSLWDKVALPNGPSTWQELLDGGRRIKAEQNVQMGIGMSNELDSNMAARALIWSFGGSEQGEDEKITINSPEVIAAVEFMTRLYKDTMTPEVFSWTAASNNQGLIAGKLSYILNSVSAYRTAQTAQPAIADDIFFTPALKGPGGEGLASEHVINIYFVPQHSKNVDAAKQFMLDLVGNYNDAVNNSELYNFPAFSRSAPRLDGWLASDPYKSKPLDKLAFLKDSESWSTNVGHPGPANPAVGEVFGTFILPQMMAKAARGQLTPKEAVEDAEKRMIPIYDKWRKQKLVGG
jgi:ABC-type glycerol-3-phosphate transport system substrate-binding protein